MDEPKPADSSAAPSDDQRAITRRRLLHGGLGLAAASGAGWPEGSDDGLPQPPAAPSIRL